jgi:hypothetical protein
MRRPAGRAQGVDQGSDRLERIESDQPGRIVCDQPGRIAWRSSASSGQQAPLERSHLALLSRIGVIPAADVERAVRHEQA